MPSNHYLGWVKMGKCKFVLLLGCFSLLTLSSTNLRSSEGRLTPRSAKSKILEISRSHVNYYHLDRKVWAKRALANYLEEIDPLKTYLTEAEVDPYMNPSEELIERLLKDFDNAKFLVFEEIQVLWRNSLVRRRDLEKQIDLASTPLLDAKEIENSPWPKDDASLLARIAAVAKLQFDAAEKWFPDEMDSFFQRIQKKRLHKEDELSGKLRQNSEEMSLILTLKAFSSALDSQTHYFTSKEASQFLIQVQQKLSGIGAQLRDDLSGFAIVRLIEGGAAERLGTLKVGDKIVSVNGEPVVGLDIADAVELIRGPDGSSVNLTIVRKNEQNEEDKFDVQITRTEVVIHESRMESELEPYGNGAIGIIKLHSFYQDEHTSSAKDMHKFLSETMSQMPLKGVILDLRTNSGGFLPQAVAVSSLFMKKGVVVSVRDNTQKIDHLRNFGARPLWDGPLIILISKASASASEIVAQTLQEYGRAIVVGDETSFGKGSFQTFSLEPTGKTKVNPNGEFKVTRGLWYTVSGKTPQLTGVHSDIVIPSTLAELEIGEKYSKFPLEPDQIPPLFDDDLSNIAMMHRQQLLPHYRKELQEVSHEYSFALPILKANAEERLKHKKVQLAKLTLPSKDQANESLDEQQQEAINVMKDLIYLQSQGITSGKSA